MTLDSIAPWLLALVLAAPALGLLRLQPSHLADDGADDPAYTRTVAIAVHDSVELLDFAGPGEVFEVAGGLAADRGRRALRVVTVAPHAGTIRSQGFLDVAPTFAAAEAPRAHVLVVPGGDPGVVLRDRAFLGWIEGAARDAEVVLSVCTGAFVLGAIGALDGREATTWHGRVEALGAAVPRARVVAGRRFVDAGTVVTTAGVSAGIDGALHLVARRLGFAVARRTAAYMEYRWEPEAAHAALYPAHNPAADETGRAVEAASFPDGRTAPPGAARALREVLAADPAHGDAWFHLARALAREGALDEALDAAERAAGFRYAAAAATYDRACIRALRGDRDGALADLSTARAAGIVGEAEADPDLATLRGA